MIIVIGVLDDRDDELNLISSIFCKSESKYKYKNLEVVTVRYRFFDVFQEAPSGGLTPRRRIRISGVEFSPGVTFTRGVKFSGVYVFSFYGQDIDAEEENDVLVIKGFLN